MKTLKKIEKIILFFAFSLHFLLIFSINNLAKAKIFFSFLCLFLYLFYFLTSTFTKPQCKSIIEFITDSLSRIRNDVSMTIERTLFSKGLVKMGNSCRICENSLILSAVSCVYDVIIFANFTKNKSFMAVLIIVGNSLIVKTKGENLI